MSKEKPINISWGDAIETSERWKSYPQNDLSEKMKEFMKSLDRLIDQEVKEALLRMHMAWDEYWEQAYGELGIKTAADLRTAIVFGLQPSTIEKRRRKHWKLSKL